MGNSLAKPVSWVASPSQFRWRSWSVALATVGTVAGVLQLDKRVRIKTGNIR